MTSEKLKESKKEMYMKRKMIDNGKLSEEQTGNYVMYYIFYKEEPVYVGITKNFAARKGQHFSEQYRRREASKKLYRHMGNNNIEDYTMYIVSQSRKAKTIEGMEEYHISQLRSLDLAKTNVANGGGYVRSVDTAKRDVELFISKYLELEDKAITRDEYDEFDYTIDFDIYRDVMNDIDWELLHSVFNCREHDIMYEYGVYKKNNKRKAMSFERFSDISFSSENSYLADLRGIVMGASGFISWIIDEKYTIRRDIKEKSIDNFMTVLNYIKRITDPVELYLAINILLFQDNDSDLVIAIENSGYDPYMYIERLSNPDYMEVVLNV